MTVQRVVFEGNIGAGKTSLARLVQACNPDRFRFYPEPIDQWNLPASENVLEQFYDRQPGAGFLAQTLIGQTLLERDVPQSPNRLEIGLYERSLVSAKMTFIPTMLEEGWLSNNEAVVLDRSIGFNMGHWPQLRPEQIVYVQCHPTVCFDRLQSRSSIEKGRITQAYLDKLHRFHETWLGSEIGDERRVFPAWTGPDVITVDTTGADQNSMARMAWDLAQVLLGKNSLHAPGSFSPLPPQISPKEG